MEENIKTVDWRVSSNVEPKVSVIIPVYNSEKFVEETIKSVLNQSYESFEIIIVDDGSADRSAEIIRTFDDPRITYVYQENQGRSKARNRGISLAKGKYIAFLDSDDVWLSRHLEIEVEILKSIPEACAVYSNVWYIGEDGKPLFRDSSWEPRKYSGTPLRNLVERNFIQFSSSIVKKQLLMEIGLFNLEMEPCEDWDLWLRIVRRGYKIQHVNKVLTKYRWKDSNDSEIYQRTMAAGSLKVLFKLYKSEKLDKTTLLFWKRGYLVQINNSISFSSRKSSFLQIKRCLGQYPNSLLTLINEPLFWKIILRFLLGKKGPYFTRVKMLLKGPVNRGVGEFQYGNR